MTEYFALKSENVSSEFRESIRVSIKEANWEPKSH